MISPRILRITVALVLAGAAILGYVVGHARSGTPAMGRMRSASIAGVLLNYPATWKPAAGAPPIPGLSISNPVVLAPGGDSTRAGLITGQLPAGEPAPLPSAFVVAMRRLPDTEVVDLLETQAYRYRGVSIPAFAGTLTVFVIPRTAPERTALACYASPAFSNYMRTCEQIVATLALVGQSQSHDLSPEPRFAGELGALIAMLDGQRLTLRRQMRPQAGPATVAALATRLAAGFATAAAALAALEPPFATVQAQAALSRSIGGARDAYTALAAAASAQDQSGSVAARTRVYQAESSVDAALSSFLLLGYKQA